MGYYDNSFKEIFEYNRNDSVSKKIFVEGDEMDDFDKFVILDAEIEDENEIPEIVDMVKKHKQQLMDDREADGVKLYIDDEIISLDEQIDYKHGANQLINKLEELEVEKKSNPLTAVVSTKELEM